MTEQEAQRVNEWVSKTTTFCVGRMMLDLPHAFVLNSELRSKIDDVRINITPQDRALFNLNLERRRQELSNSTLLGSTQKSLKDVISLPEGDGVVFDRSRNMDSNVLRTHELWVWKNGFSISMQADARDMSFSDRPDGRPTDTAEVLSNLLKLAARVRGRQPHEVPTEAGACITNGFVSGPASEHETVPLAFHLDGSRDVYFKFVSETDLQESDSLLERSAKVEREMKASGTTTVRKGARTIHGQAWEEWLFKGPTPERVDGTMFTAIANEKIGSPQTPYVSFDLFNGFAIPHPPLSLEESARWPKLEKATLSEAEAVAIWDAVVPTLRKRPGAF